MLTHKVGRQQRDVGMSSIWCIHHQFVKDNVCLAGFFCKFWNPTLIETLVFSSGQVKAEVEGALYIGGSLLAFAGWLVAAFGWHLSGGWGWCSCQLWFWERRHEKEAYLCSWEGWKAETLTLFSRTSPYSTIQTLNTQLLSFWNFSTFFQGIFYDVNVVSIDIYFLVFNNFRFVWEYYKNGLLIMTYYVNCKAIKVKYIE